MNHNKIKVISNTEINSSPSKLIVSILPINSKFVAFFLLPTTLFNALAFFPNVGKLWNDFMGRNLIKVIGFT